MGKVLLQLLVRIAVAVVLLVTTNTAPQASQPSGFWQCDGVQWLAVGAPEHPKPLVQCGSSVTGGGGAVTKEMCEAGGGIWGPIGLFPSQPASSGRLMQAASAPTWANAPPAAMRS